MRIFFVMFFILPAVSLIATQVNGAVSVKLKFIQSIYDDGQDISLRYPEGVACNDEYFVIADTGNNRLVKYTYEDQVIKAAGFDMPVTSPITAQINSEGVIYVLDGKDRRIFIYSPDGIAKGDVKPKGTDLAKNMVPRNFTIDGNDNIYILDVFSQLVLVLDSSGNYRRHVIFPEQYGFFTDLTVDRQGTIYLIDSVEARLYSSTPDMEKFTPLSEVMKEYMNFPTRITIDNRGIIYLVDNHGGNIVLVGKDGSFLGHRFGYGRRESQFYYPSQLCISEGGNVFVADRSNSRVQMFQEVE